jgi:hypothetical protein
MFLGIPYTNLAALKAGVALGLARKGTAETGRAPRCRQCGKAGQGIEEHLKLLWAQMKHPDLHPKAWLNKATTGNPQK